jgi:hypothetical protein
MHNVIAERAMDGQSHQTAPVLQGTAAHLQRGGESASEGFSKRNTYHARRADV